MTDLTLNLICINPPPVSAQLLFGLQDKKGNLQPGLSLADGRLCFTGEVAVTRKTGDPDFGGPFVHGTPNERFLYLTYRTADGNIIRRLKAPLKSITWQQIEQGHALEATLDGNRSGSGAFVGGWRLV